MKFQGSVIKEQGITFAIVIVKKHVVDNRSTAEDAIRTFQPVFPRIPIVQCPVVQNMLERHWNLAPLTYVFKRNFIDIIHYFLNKISCICSTITYVINSRQFRFMLSIISYGMNPLNMCQIRKWR